MNSCSFLHNLKKWRGRRQSLSWQVHVLPDLIPRDLISPWPGPPRSGEPIPCAQPTDSFNAVSPLVSKPLPTSSVPRHGSFVHAQQNYSWVVALSVFLAARPENLDSEEGWDHQAGTLPAAGTSSVCSDQGREEKNHLGSALCIGGGRLSEVEQPLRFAEETDKARYWRLSNGSLVPFWNQTAPSSIHLWAVAYRRQAGARF